LQKETDHNQWEILTQEPVKTGPGVMLNAWWKILWLPF